MMYYILSTFDYLEVQYQKEDTHQANRAKETHLNSFAVTRSAIILSSFLIFGFILHGSLQEVTLNHIISNAPIAHRFS